jgi:hypothetical protein
MTTETETRTAYHDHRDARYADLEARFPLSEATAAGLKRIDAEKRAIGDEPKSQPWMSVEQNARYWATSLYINRYYRAMPAAEQALDR